MNFIRNIFNSRANGDGNFFLELEKIIGFKIKNKSLYIKAFTHRSMNIKDDEGNALNYERLEFVGDAMLGAVIAYFLFNEAPQVTGKRIRRIMPEFYYKNCFIRNYTKYKT